MAREMDATEATLREILGIAEETSPSGTTMERIAAAVEKIEQYLNYDIDAEAYAAGTRGGVPVEEGDPAYHNNAAYYNEQAQEASAGSVRFDTAQALTDTEKAQARENIKAATPDGSYGGMTAGYAEQLTSSIVETDEVPYLFRTAGGNAEIGNYENDTIVGGSVAWNQLVYNYSYTGGSGANTYNFPQGTQIVAGHKILLSAQLSEALSSNASIYLYTRANGTNYAVNLSIPAGQTHATNIRSITVGGTGGHANSNGDAWVYHNNIDADVNNFMISDLTALFGTSIADYIYSLEQANAGAGVAWLKAHGWFTKDYYPYCAPTLKSVSAVQSHDMVGFNAYDPDTGKAKVVGGMQYQITGAYTAISLDGETITPDNNGKFTPTADGELTVTGGNATTTTVHLVWDGERDGEYEAYRKESYPLDSALTLRGIPKLDASNNLYYDGDRYLPDGTIERRFAETTFDGSSDENWTLYVSTGLRYSFRSSNYVESNHAYTNMLIDATWLDVNTTSESSLNGGRPSCRTTNYDSKYFYIFASSDTFADVDALKTYLAAHPLTVIYEVVTPTTETAEPFQSTQWVDNWGTEEYVVTPDSDGVAVPVGHVTDYPVDLKAKLEATANNPQTDGIYLLQYQNGEATYTPLASDSTITDILARLTALENAQATE